MPPLTLGLGFARGPVTASAPSLVLDSLSAGAAYSTRKLRTAYTGAALRVRRSSDNTEQDIGFSGNALDTTALTSFVGANSGFVVTWYDQSGNGRDITQATQANQPRIMNAGTIDTQNTAPSVFFDGTDGLWRSGAFVYDAGAATVMAVISGGSQSGRYIWSESTAASFSAYAGSTSTSGTAIGARSSGPLGNPFVESGNPTVAAQMDNTLRCVSWRDTGSSYSVFGNGTAGTDLASYTRLAYTYDRFGIGHFPKDASADFTGYISEIIVFTSALSNANFNTVGANQGAAYGITVNPI